MLPGYYERMHESQPLAYHSHLFDYEGDASLLSYLIAEGLVTGLEADGSSYLNGISFFGIDI